MVVAGGFDAAGESLSNARNQLLRSHELDRFCNDRRVSNAPDSTTRVFDWSTPGLGCYANPQQLAVRNIGPPRL